MLRQHAILLSVLLFFFLAGSVHAQQQVNVDAKVRVRFTRPVYNPISRTYNALATIKNVSDTTLRGPMSLLIYDISLADVKLANADGQTSNGTPFIDVVLIGGELRPNRLTLVRIKFHNPRRVSFSYKHSLLAVVPSANNPPVANAGPDQTVFVGDVVTLDGSGSCDVDGDSLSFTWSFSSRPTGSLAALSDIHAVKPTLQIDVAGTYNVQLVVNDGKVDSTADSVVISTQNSKPLANAGPDQTTFVGQSVTLDGSQSSDVDGDSLTFKWSFVSRPVGSTATLQNPTNIDPTFVPDNFGDYIVQLIVNDGLLDSLPATVKVSTLNSPPVSNAGANQTAYVGDTIVLDGSGSTDVDGNFLTYSWSFVSKPQGSTANIQNPNSVNPSFVIDVFGD